MNIRSSREIEKEHTLKILRLMNYHRVNTAKALGIHKNTLRNRLKKYGIKLKRVY